MKLYRKQEDIKNILKYGTSLDLTSDRYNLLNKARERVEEVEGINFVYADVNCLFPIYINGLERNIKLM